MLNKSKNVRLPFGRFPFHSRIHPTRCLNCQTYGHNISKCQNPRVCEHCPTTALKPLLSFVFPALNQSALAMTTPQHPLFVAFIDNKCDSRWEVRLGNDAQPLILKSTMYLCLLNSLSSILGLLVVNLLLYSILSFLLNLTSLLWRKFGFLKTQTMSQNMTLCLMAFMSCTHTNSLVNEVEVFLWFAETPLDWMPLNRRPTFLLNHWQPKCLFRHTISIGDLPSSEHRQFYLWAHVSSLSPLFSFFKFYIGWWFQHPKLYVSWQPAKCSFPLTLAGTAHKLPHPQTW